MLAELPKARVLGTVASNTSIVSSLLKKLELLPGMLEVPSVKLGVPPVWSPVLVPVDVPLPEGLPTIVGVNVNDVPERVFPLIVNVVATLPI